MKPKQPNKKNKPLGPKKSSPSTEESTRINKETFLANIKHEGSYHIGRACDIAGVSRQTYYNWLKSDPGFAEKIAEMNEVPVDDAENLVHKRIKGGDIKTARWLLDRRGSQRGYRSTVRNEHTGPDGGPIQMSAVAIDEMPIELRKQVLKFIRTKNAGQ